MNDIETFRKQMILVGYRLYKRGLVGGSTGNLSLRLRGGKFLVTPSRKNKAFLQEKDLIIVNIDGKVVEGNGHPTSELPMHISIYQRCPEVNAIVHAHPPFTVALTLVGFRLDYPYLPEAIPLKIGMATYSTPGTKEVPSSILGLLVKHKVIVLERHGAVSLGKDLFEAFDLMDELEHIARIYWAARCLGPFTPLTLDQIKRFKEVWHED
ncbi:MAG TPA: class II aldolase/adducin family protein [Candidatus Desulfofervidus auxilii]|uniref:Class II aldolase/adducin family protein n=1 Tax=Desulfofervidus auxilii TaxID=1621989 RepID=A0A7V0IAK3_DESA2|nr:class II aldolase/adducin family protein [Candidatus Desulfofervidus auxilii]